MAVGDSLGWKDGFSPWAWVGGEEGVQSGMKEAESEESEKKKMRVLIFPVPEVSQSLTLPRGGVSTGAEC